MTIKSPASPSFPANSSIDTAGPQAEHRRIAHEALLKSRRPSEVVTSDEQRAIGANNGALPSDIPRGK